MSATEGAKDDRFAVLVADESIGFLELEEEMGRADDDLYLPLHQHCWNRDLIDK